MRQGGKEKVRYLLGLGNELASEALSGALPVGQNSPQRPPHGLVSELVSGTTFGAARSLNRRSYLFRIRPSVLQGRFRQIELPLFRTPPFGMVPSPNHFSWGPFRSIDRDVDFLDGLVTICGSGSAEHQIGMAAHAYSASVSMTDRAFADADAELLLVPQVGAVRIVTELGIVEAGLGEIVVVPRGVKLRVELLEKRARGFLLENFGLPLRLPELGLIGSNGLANAADFEIPVAAYEERVDPVELVQKLAGRFWSAPLAHSPFDVVAWRGTLYPYRYDLRRFVAMGTLTVDHPDPSIFSLLTSPSDPVLGPNFDVMAITPRWIVAERSFRPPGYHRNCVSELILFLQGFYGDLEAGSSTMTNPWTPHGPETATIETGRNQELAPQKIEDMLLLLFETRFPIQVTEFGETAPELLRDYAARWDGFEPYFGRGENR